MQNATTMFQTILMYKVRFIAVFFLIFTLSYGLLYVIDFLPEPIQSDGVVSIESEAEPLTTVSAEELNITDIVETEPGVVEPTTPIIPTEIYIEKLDKTLSVLNPASRSIADLDAALLDGVVRHPDSATLNQEGNVFILGHSSYLPNVLNKNFQAFNGIQNLEWGDEIVVSGGDSTYVYRVEKVYEAKASEIVVPIAGTEHRLTIATCDSFGSTDDRYIVEATLYEVQVS